MTSCGLVRVFKILTSILNIDDDQIASSGLDDVFRISALILNIEDNDPSSNRLSCLVVSRCFTRTLIISNGAVIVVDWLEVVTSSQISSSRPFRLARMSNELPYLAELN